MVLSKGAKMRPKKIGYSLTDGVTQSLLSNWVSCRQRAKFFCDGWESLKVKDALAFGSLFHWLLESYYNSIIRGQADPNFAHHFKPWQEKTGNLMADQQQVENMAAMAQALFEGYVIHWRKDLERQWVAVEAQFDVKLGHHRLRGMRDGLYRVKGKPWLLETKTMAQIRDDVLSDTLTFDFQNLYYITATELTIKEPVEGVLYNIIRKPSLKPGDSLAAYFERVSADVMARPETYFVRYEIAYPKAVKDRFKRELQIKLNEFEAWHKGDILTYKNEAACAGRWACEYLPACASNTMAGFAQTREIFRELHQ